MEKILEIKEVSDVKDAKDSWMTMDGYEVVTDKQSIQLLISNGQSCCENWGYLFTNDDMKEFVGAELKGISLTDTALNTRSLPEYGYDSGDVMFVNLDTSKGVLQFAAYNAHNGYYGHTAVVQSAQLMHSQGL